MTRSGSRAADLLLQMNTNRVGASSSSSASSTRKVKIQNETLSSQYAFPPAITEGAHTYSGQTTSKITPVKSSGGAMDALLDAVMVRPKPKKSKTLGPTPCACEGGKYCHNSDHVEGISCIGIVPTSQVKLQKKRCYFCKQKKLVGVVEPSPCACPGGDKCHYTNHEEGKTCDKMLARSQVRLGHKRCSHCTRKVEIWKVNKKHKDKEDTYTYNEESMLDTSSPRPLL